MNIQFVVRWNQQYINDLYYAVAASSNPGGKGFAKFITQNIGPHLAMMYNLI